MKIKIILACFCLFALFGKMSAGQTKASAKTITTWPALVVSSKTNLRISRDSKSRVLSTVSKGTYLMVVYDGGRYWAVLMSNNTIAWVPKTAVRITSSSVDLDVTPPSVTLKYKSTISTARPVESRLTPADSKKYAFADLPYDGEPHWLILSGQGDQKVAKKYGVSFLFLKGIGAGRTQDEAYEGKAFDTDMIRSGARRDDAAIGVYAFVYEYKDGTREKSILIYLQSTPAEAETHIGSLPINIENGRKLLSHLDDMLRIVNKWQAEPESSEDKKVIFSAINSNNTISGLPATLPDTVAKKLTPDLNMALDQRLTSRKQGWYVWSDRVIFCSNDIVALAKFRNKVETAIKWVDRQP